MATAIPASALELQYWPIDQIIIGEQRQREGLGAEENKAKVAFEDLKKSIQNVGLLSPIRVSGDGSLIAGYRRLTAAKDLGWLKVPVIVGVDEELDELTLEIMELDENIQRHDLTWQERANAIARLDEIRKKQNPTTWTQQKTAEEVGTTQGKVSEAVMLKKMAELFPEIGKAKTKKQALSMANQKSKSVLRRQEITSNPVTYQDIITKVKLGKAEEVIETMADGEAGRLCLTDGPFGINYDKRQAGVEGGHEAYEDSPESYRERTARMAPHLYRVLKDDGFLIWFLGHDHLDWTRQTFRDAGFTVDPLPLIWDRSEGRSYTVRPDRYFPRAYDIALHCLKGNPEISKRGRVQGNVFRFKPVAVSEKEHIVERPIELYTEIIDHLTIAGEKVTDFFGGSGKVAAAAAKLGRDHFTVEINPNHIPTIVTNIFNNTPQKEK